MQGIFRWPLMVVGYLCSMVRDLLINLRRNWHVVLILLTIGFVRYLYESKRASPQRYPGMFASPNQVRYPAPEEGLFPYHLRRAPDRTVQETPAFEKNDPLSAESNPRSVNTSGEEGVHPAPQPPQAPVEAVKPSLPLSERLPQILELSESIGMHLRARSRSMDAERQARLLAAWQQNDAELRSLSRQLAERGLSPDRKVRLEAQVERLESKNAELDRAAWDYRRR